MDIQKVADRDLLALYPKASFNHWLLEAQALMPAVKGHVFEESPETLLNIAQNNLSCLSLNKTTSDADFYEALSDHANEILISQYEHYTTDTKFWPYGSGPATLFDLFDAGKFERLYTLRADEFDGLSIDDSEEETAVHAISLDFTTAFLDIIHEQVLALKEIPKGQTDYEIWQAMMRQRPAFILPMHVNTDLKAIQFWSQYQDQLILHELECYIDDPALREKILDRHVLRDCFAPRFYSSVLEI